MISVSNLELAAKRAALKKAKQPGVIDFNKNREFNLLDLNAKFLKREYKTSLYTTFFIEEPKQREIFRLPFYPDRIMHHAVMNVLQPIFISTFTADTYSCIPERGIHAASFALRSALEDVHDTTYCLKLDIKKFYPNIDHDVLKNLLRRKIKDKDLLHLLDEVIESAPGLPIGNYLSQYFANFYLTYFDHWIKEKKGVKNYFRYADDLVILSSSKAELHQLLADIRIYLRDELKLTVKDNYQIFPVWARGIDFVGYVHYHECVYLRKSIKQNFARKVSKKINLQSIASYKGWLKYGDCINLTKKLLNEHRTAA